MKKTVIALLALATLSTATLAAPVRFPGAALPGAEDSGPGPGLNESLYKRELQGTYVTIPPLSEQEYRSLSGSDRKDVLNRPGTSLRKVIFVKPAKAKPSFQERSMLSRDEREAAGLN